MAMIAADAFGVPLEKVRVETSDTSTAPYAGMAGGSKTVYTVGPAVQQAAVEARRQLLEIAGAELEAAPEDLVIEDGHVQVSGVPSRRLEVGHLAGLAAQFGGKYPPVLGQGRAAVTQQSPMLRGLCSPACEKKFPRNIWTPPRWTWLSSAYRRLSSGNCSRA